MSDTVLFVDDDKAILAYAAEIFLGKGCRLVTLDDPFAALEFLGREEVAVLVSDNQMPGLNGIDLIARANEVCPDTVKIIMTAYADLSVALCAINQCQVFRFIQKPWQPEQILGVVRDSLRRFRTLQTMRRENEDILHSLAQTIELKDPSTMGHCERVATYAVMIAKAVDLSVDMQREIRYGSWLHDCGKIGIPEQVLNAARKLECHEYELMKKHSGWGAEVALKARLSNAVINIVHFHHERYDGKGYPSSMQGEQIPIEARIVAVADVYDALTSDRPYRPRFSRQEALQILGSMKGNELDPSLVEIFVAICPPADG